MTTDMPKDPGDQAVYWLLRQRACDMDEAEWDAFTDWLEASEDHAALLDEVTAADDALGLIGAENTVLEASNSDNAELDDLPEAANDNQFKRFLPFAGMVAAAVAVFALWPTAPTATLYSTEPGETQIVAVSDDITVTLNGGSEVSVIEGETRVAITQGEVIFAIDSDEPSPLRVEVADLVLTDYGTVFNVVLNDDAVSVAVSEGVVGINPDDENIEVEAGTRVTQRIGDDAFIRTEVDPETIGAWQDGRLEFDNTPASEAVAMLERSLGVTVILAPALQSQTLTGSLIISDDRERAVTQFAAFLGASAEVRSQADDGEVWDIR